MQDLFDTTIQEHVDVGDVFRVTSIYTAFERTYKRDHTFPGERHNFWELEIVTNGEIGFTADNNIYTLKKGQAILHKPMEFHSLWCEIKYNPKIIVFTFAAENVPNYTSQIFEVKEIASAQYVLRQIQSAFEFQKINLTGIKEDAYMKHQLAVKSLESFVIETLSQQSKRRSNASSHSMKNYTTIVNVLEANIDKNLSVPEIAQLCNMSEVNLKQTFSRYAGIGIKNYFNKLKVNTAIQMIQSGMTMQEVSDALGFSSQYYFSTVFKRITGHAPSYYR